MFGDTALIYANFTNVNGLQAGNSVRYSGIDVGTVTDIEMFNDTVITIEMTIDHKMLRHIKQDAIATIGSDGLVGSMIINILPGNGREPLVASGDFIKTYSRIRTEDLLKTLNVTNENAALLTVDLLKITKEITHGKGSVGVLLNDREMATDLKATMGNLKLSTESAARTLNLLEKLSTDLNADDNAIGFLTDTTMRKRLDKIVLNLDTASATLDTAITQANTIMSNIKKGNGALNYLANDPKAVQKIDSILTGINTASQLLNEDLKAAQHNFLLRGYFNKKNKKKSK